MNTIRCISFRIVSILFLYNLQAVGEPPLFLAASVFFAIKDAISSARRDRGVTGHFRLDTPATCERIRMACVDQFTEQVIFKLKQEFSIIIIIKMYCLSFVYILLYIQVCAGADPNAKRWTIEA